MGSIVTHSATKSHQYRKFETAHPWEKSPEELTQFDWLTAVGLSGQHRTTPTDLRIAQELVRFSSNETNLAWPTMETLAEYVGCHRNNASKSIGNLKSSGALMVQPIGHLPDELRQPIKRKGRGNAYCLNIRWAYDVLAAKPYMRECEPIGLKNGRLKRTSNATDTSALLTNSNATTPVAINATTPVALQCNGHRGTNIEGEIEGNRFGAGKRKLPIAPLPENPTAQQVDGVVRNAMRGLHAFRDERAA